MHSLQQIRRSNLSAVIDTNELTYSDYLNKAKWHQRRSDSDNNQDAHSLAWTFASIVDTGPPEDLEYFSQQSLEEDLYNYDSNKKTRAGFHIGRYKEGDRKYASYYVNNKLHGAYISWFKNGSVKAGGYYVLGKRDGAWQEYPNLDIDYWKITYDRGEVKSKWLESAESARFFWADEDAFDKHLEEKRYLRRRGDTSIGKY
jgi:hypothetical protein